MLAFALLTVLLAQAPDAAPQVEIPPEPPQVQLVAPPAQPQEPSVCDDWRAHGLQEGPAMAAVYGHADLTSGRRACPRTEIGLGGTLGLVVDRPNFYGNIAAVGVLYGSYALNAKTELFGSLNFVEYQQVIGALTTSSLSLGDLSVGVNRTLYTAGRFTGALTARVLLPSASDIPNVRELGADVGHAVSWRALRWLEVHGFAGAGFITGLSAAPLAAPTVVGLLGAQASPTSWFAVVLDLSGGLANRSFFAPTLALRFRAADLGIELAASKSLAGTDRHLLIGGARVSWRF